MNARLNRAISTSEFRRTCEPYEIKYMDAAFDGDVKAAMSLSVSLNNDMRGHMAVAMWRAKVTKEAFRAYLTSAWDHDHREVIEAAETRRTLSYMFRYASFPLPAELPDVVTVWRGSSFLSFDKAKTGYSWSTDRETACWFAMRFADRNGSPLVLTADVAKRDIALFTDDRSESEVVLMRPPSARIDGDVSNWNACFQRKQDIMVRDRKAMLSECIAESLEPVE